MTAAITRRDRWSRENPCPVCGGCDQDERGKGKRCTGFLSSDGDYLHCSREEHAGGIEPSGDTYGHRRHGPCKCGTTHGEDRGERSGSREIVARYVYETETRAPLFRVVRTAGKDFYQQHPDASAPDGWAKGRNGVALTVYRLPDLLADDQDRPVYVVEGEKDVEALWKRGHVATCNPGGAGKWHHVADVARTVLQGREVVVVADNDEPGRKHARDVAASLQGIARSVRVVRCPTAKDVSDHFAAAGTLDQLVTLEREHGADAPPWERLVIDAPAAWFTTKPAARAWLLRDGRRPKADGLLPLGKVGQVIAEGGAGKTMAAFQLAISVATLVPWLGAFDVAIPGQDGRPRAGRVLVVVGEEDADEAHRRLYRARKATDAPIPPEGSIVVLPLAGVPCPMLTRDEHGEPVDAPFLTWLRAYVEAHGPWDLVIVDPLSRFAGPDAETDNATGTRFIQSLESIATLTGATVLVCHHTNKLSRRGGTVDSSAGRGSTALVDGARWECSLSVERVTLDDPAAQERLGTLVTWAHTKSNYSRRAEGLVLRSDGDNGGALVPLDPAELEAVQASRGRDPGQVAKAAAKDVQRGAQEADEDAAVLRAVTERPGIALRELATIVQAVAHVGRERAYVAIARVADRLDVREGPRKARLHYPRPAEP